MSVDELTSSWRHPGERALLVERVIAEHRARLVAEAKVRVLMGDRDRVSGLTARVVELEALCESLNRKLSRRNR